MTMRTALALVALSVGSAAAEAEVIKKCSGPEAVERATLTFDNVKAIVLVETAAGRER